MSQHFIDTDNEFFMELSGDQHKPTDSEEDGWSSDEESTNQPKNLDYMFGSPITDFGYEEVYSSNYTSEDEDSQSEQSSSSEDWDELEEKDPLLDNIIDSDQKETSVIEEPTDYLDSPHSINHKYMKYCFCGSEKTMSIDASTLKTNLSHSYKVKIATKVKFAECLVSLTVEDSIDVAQELLAYRKSDVASHLADKQRFMDRICRVGKNISPVFKTSHRNKVWKRINNCNDICDAFIKDCKVDISSTE